MGTPGNDSLTGTAGNDTLSGDDGSDTLVGLDGDDSLLGGAGYDSLFGNAGNDTLDGGDGGGWMSGENGDDLLLGGYGGDVLHGGAGSDTIYLQGALAELASTTNHASAGADNDHVFGSAGKDYVTGDAGNDTLTGGDGSDTLFGGADADWLNGAMHDDSLMGDDGNDTMIGGDGADYLSGGAGNDFLAGDVLSGPGVELAFSRGNTLSGGDGDDRVLGSLNDDYVTGGTGSDSLVGGAGNDILTSDTGVLDTGVEVDTLIGGDGNDTYYVGANDIAVEFDGGGIDTITTTRTAFSMGTGFENLRLEGVAAARGYGNGADNTMWANRGDTLFNAGAGIDTVSYEFESTGGITLWLALVTAQATGGSGSDTLIGFENAIGSGYADSLRGTSLANFLDGRAGNDTLRGGDGADTLAGGAGDDLLIGDSGSDTVDYSLATKYVSVDLADQYNYRGEGSGFDTLISIENATGSKYNDWFSGTGDTNSLAGGAGNDNLDGRGGRDVLTGGTGADHFRISDASYSGPDAPTRDLVVDFSHAEGDLIDLSSMDANGDVEGSPVFVFIGTAAFSADATGQVRYDAVNGIVYGSMDADADAEFSIEIAGAPALVAGDFVM
jgi:Ca2+-binding RTX toxin-like protein